MIKTICTAVLPAAIFLFGCNTNQPTDNSQQDQTTEQTEIPENEMNEHVSADTVIQTDTITTSPDNVRADQTDQNTNRQTQEKKEIESITVSFISIGEGIDGDAFKEYKAFLDNWSVSGKKPSYETIGWGREGETDLCIDMKNISDSDSKKLLEQTRRRLAGNSLVQIETNKACRESRIRK